MRTPPKSLTRTALLVLLLAMAGCSSAIQSSPDNPMSAGGLTPNVKDQDVGLVAMAPGFDVSKYKVIVVEKFPVTDRELKDEGDRRFAAKMAPKLQLELVRRLKDSGLFQRVVNTSAAQYQPGAEPALRLQGAITRLGRGSQVARYFVGAYGIGRARAQADMRLIDASSGRVVMVTADRWLANVGMFGGDDEDLLEQSFDGIAESLAKLLVRLSKGEKPGK
ncbi:MAG TPA: DUF4410 domain-containing protein [Methylomirabilota bacterium]|jgi:hypothetical protein|nr:DUF4410 domain-containing protein [Methylomirabilota bacterium]